MSKLRQDFGPKDLSVPEREELVQRINFIFENDNAVSRPVLFAKWILKESSGAVFWSDISISQFLSKGFFVHLPDASKQQDLFRMISDKSNDLGFGASDEKEPLFKGADPELFKKLKAVFNYGKNHRITYTSFERSFNNQQPPPPGKIAAPWIGKFLKDRGKNPHGLTVKVRDSLIEFIDAFHQGELKIDVSRYGPTPSLHG